MLGKSICHRYRGRNLEVHICYYPNDRIRKPASKIEASGRGPGLVGLTMILTVLPPRPAVMPILPDSHLPQQKLADSGTAKKRRQPNPSLIPHPSCTLFLFLCPFPGSCARSVLSLFANMITRHRRHQEVSGDGRNTPRSGVSRLTISRVESIEGASS